MTKICYVAINVAPLANAILSRQADYSGFELVCSGNIRVKFEGARGVFLTNLINCSIVTRYATNRAYANYLSASLAT